MFYSPLVATPDVELIVVDHLFDIPKTRIYEDEVASSSLIKSGIAIAFKGFLDLPEKEMFFSLHGPICHERESSKCTNENDCPTSEIIHFWNEVKDREHDQTDEHIASMTLARYIAKFSGSNFDYPCFIDAAEQSFAMVLLPTENYPTLDLAILRCLQLIQDFYETLRHTNMSKMHRFSINSMHPIYFVIGDTPKRKLKPILSIYVRGTQFNEGSTRKKVDGARQLFWYYKALALESPMSKYLGFELDARNSLEILGDYQDAVIKMAIAIEILVKNLAMSLEWERLTYPNRFQKTSSAEGNIFEEKPIKVMTGPLSEALGGNWDRKKGVGSPVSDWYNHIKLPRDQVAHMGVGVAREEAEIAMRSLESIRKHCLDRLAANPKSYPITGLIFLNYPGIQNRGLIKNYREVLRSHDILEESNRLNSFIREQMNGSV
jgi:hypothetical protein